MARIIKVTSTTASAPKIMNPAKKSAGTTNPFKYSNFEGNTLQFADVFEGFQPQKETNAMKVIATSVAGSMHKFRTNITEPVVNFVKSVYSDITGAWDYAKNTNVSDLAAVKSLNSLMTKEISIPGTRTIDKILHKPITLPKIKPIGETLNAWKESVSASWEVLNTDVTDLGKTIGTKWDTLVERVSVKKLSSETPVSELEQTWKEELVNEYKGVA